MKCIKSKCRFYKSHDYYSSYYSCTVAPITRTRKFEADYDCVIPEAIQDLLKEIKNLEDILEENEDLQ